MTQRTQPVEHARPISTVTVDRSGRDRGALGKAIVAAAVVAAIAAIAVPLLRSGLPQSDLLREALDSLETLLADARIAPATSSADAGDTAGDGDETLQRLHAAIAGSDRQTVAALIGQLPPAKLDVALDGMTALMRAASAGRGGIIKDLVHAGADPDARGSQQRSALQYAAETNRIKAARVLLDAGADIDGVDTGSLSPLVMAADRGYTDFALMLIRRGASVNIQNVDGWTALMDAAEAGDVRLVKALLEAGAEPGARHRNGWTALDFAREGNHPEVVRLLTLDGKPLTRRRTATGLPPAAALPQSDDATLPIVTPATATAPDATLPPKKGSRQ